MISLQSRPFHPDINAIHSSHHTPDRQRQRQEPIDSTASTSRDEIIEIDVVSAFQIGSRMGMSSGSGHAVGRNKAKDPRSQAPRVEI